MKKYYFSLVLLQLIGLIISTPIVGQNCTTPIISATTAPSFTCSGETATVTATTDGTSIFWYNAATAGTLLGSGSPFTTSALNQSGSVWVEAQSQGIGNAASGGGKLNPSSTSGSTVVAGTSPWGLQFNATQSFILNSVDVFLSSTSAGTLVIHLKDANLNILENISVQTPPGGSGANPVQFTVPLNFSIPVGNAYKLVVVSNPSMIRDLSGNAFPYPIGSVGSITQGTINNANTNPNVYYFLYNWNYSPVTLCVSERTEVQLAVTPTPELPAGESTQLFTTGQTLNDLNITGTNLMWYSDGEGTNSIPNSTVLIEGTTYYVSQTVDGCTSALKAIFVTTDLNVEENKLKNVRFYPNPTTDSVHFSNSGIIDSYKMYNVLGQLIKSKSVHAESFSINLNNLAGGLYLIELISDNESKLIKIQKN